MKIFVFAAMLLLGSGIASAQELFPLQKVQVQQVQASPEIVSVIATPAAFLASSGTVNAQLSTTCLGPCPSVPSYELASNPSGPCSGNNNASFSLTPAGHLTAGGLGSTVYACVKVTMPEATNTGNIWLLQMTSVASPSINVVTLRHPYFDAGSAFSSPIDLTCQPPSVLGSTADYTLCTGVPIFTLDNTPGDCAQPNNSLFALSDSALSLPPQNSGDFYACVKVAMAGAPSAPFQLKASVSTSETGSPAISGVYFNPPFYATNSPYSGKLVTYCVNNTVQSSVGLFAIHCPSTPTYSFSASCGGNNNNNFTLSGPNNDIITSNGSLSSGNLFPCIVPTMAGAQGSGTALYVNLYSGGPSTLAGISVYPTFFSTTKGSMTGALRPMCANAECTGSPQYALSTACPSNNNSLFTLNGSALSITPAAPGTYNACLSLAMTGAGNTGASFQVPVTITASTGNCPAAPPPQAADAGFTTLLKCLDGADPQNASLFNWANCTRGVVQSNSNQFWNFDGLGVDCGTSLGDQEVSQVVDPMTGDTVLKIHWDGKADTDLGLGNFFTLHEEARDFPTAIYAEISMRMVPDHVASYSSQCCGPDFWTFSTQSTYLPPGCVQSDPTNFCYNAIPEVDIMESGNGIGLLDAVHQYGLPDPPPPGVSFGSGQGYFSSGDTPTLEMWNANNLAGVPFQGYTSFGTRFLTDGVKATQYCYYWDNVLVQSFTGSGTPHFAPACQSVDFTAAGSNALAWALRGRHQFNAWFAGGWAFDSYVCQQYSGTCAGNGQQGPENQDTYLRYIAIWGPPNADQYNLGNGFDSQPPAPVAQPWPY